MDLEKERGELAFWRVQRGREIPVVMTTFDIEDEMGRWGGVYLQCGLAGRDWCTH